MQPDLIILNARAITFDPALPRAGAIAVAGGRIKAVGMTEEIRSLAGPSTRIFDAQGCTLLPGFIDSHVHLFIGAAELDALDLAGVTGEDALAGQVRRFARDRTDDRIVYAVGADYGLLGQGREITRQDLDRVLPDLPLAIMAADHHTVWANTPALEMAGLLEAPAAPPGSEVVRAGDGTASGKLLETGAFGPVLALTRYGGRDLAGYVSGADPSPVPNGAERAVDRDVIAKGLRHCAANGITTLHNMDGNFYQLELLDALRDSGDLRCRVQVPCHLRPEHGLGKLEEALEMRARFADDWIWSGRVKMFMDGVIDGYTAFMLETYPGRPNSHGEALFEAEAFNEICVAADREGLQISVHAIGDAAVRRTLDGYQAARAANGPRDSRHRIEHIETLRGDDLPRFAELGVVASMQPLHAPAGGLFPVPSADILRPEQIALAYPWRSLRRAGAALVFSTDWPVVPVDVMPSIRAAVATRTPKGWPEQGLTLMEALAAYTCENAWVEFTEDRKGRISSGYLADLVVMSHDLEAMQPSELGQARPVLTLCGGAVTFEA